MIVLRIVVGVRAVRRHGARVIGRFAVDWTAGLLLACHEFGDHHTLAQDFCGLKKEKKKKKSNKTLVIEGKYVIKYCRN